MWFYPGTPLDEREAMLVAYFNAVAGGGMERQYRILIGSTFDRDIAIIGMWHYAIIFLLAEYAGVPLEIWCNEPSDAVITHLFSHPAVELLFDAMNRSMQAGASYTDVVAPLTHNGDHRSEWVWRVVSEIYIWYASKSTDQEHSVHPVFKFYCQNRQLPGRDRVIALYGNIDLQGRPWIKQTLYEPALPPDEDASVPPGDTSDVVTRII